MLLPFVGLGLTVETLKGHVQQEKQTRMPVTGHQQATGDYQVILKVSITIVSGRFLLSLMQ